MDDRLDGDAMWSALTDEERERIRSGDLPVRNRAHHDETMDDSLRRAAQSYCQEYGLDQAFEDSLVRTWTRQAEIMRHRGSSGRPVRSRRRGQRPDVPRRVGRPTGDADLG